MKLKIKDKYYENAFVPNYGVLIDRLKIILNNNKNLKTFQYYGIVKNDKVGILVEGIDSLGVREFQNFYSIYEINFYFNELVKRLIKR